MNKPLVSVTIPTYNQHKYIEKAINSILNQTYNNIEIIISDDSPNNLTEELVKEKYLNKIFNGKIIKYFHNHKPKGQVGNYRYMLYELATGDWVLNVDGDDFLYRNDFIEKAMDYVVNNNNIVLVTSKKMKYDAFKNKFIEVSHIPESDLRIDGEWLFFNHIFKNIEIPHIGTICNRKKALELDFYKYLIPSTDRESLLKLSLIGDIVYLSDYYGVWVYHGDNHSQNVEVKELLENLKMYERLYLYAKQKKLNLLKLNIWKIVAKYKSIFYYYNSYDRKNKYKLINELKKDHKFYLFLLNIDFRNWRKK